MSRTEPEFDLEELVAAWRRNVEIKDRRYRLKTFESCFVGSEACAWLLSAGIAKDEGQAVALGNMLQREGVFHHVLRDHDFANEYLFYRFSSDEDHGHNEKRDGGQDSSWLDIVDSGLGATGREDRLARLPSYEDELPSMTATKPLGVEPLDRWNGELLDNVHPRSWNNPTPKGTYNMVVIGAGTAGLVTAAAAAGLGARVALVESHLLGGDCLNVGCVPSKALLRCAKAAAAVRQSAKYGLRLRGSDEPLAEHVEVDFGAVMERLRRLRATISHHDSAARFAREFGIDVFIGRGKFTGPKTIEVNGQELEFAKAAIATGASPVAPPIPGLSETPFLTNVSVFNLTRRPPRLAVIGGGVIGVEMAQAFQRLGSQVTLIERAARILPREDLDAAKIVRDELANDGVIFKLGSTIERVRHEAADDEDWPTITISLDSGSLEVDALLVATGRRPNVAGLGLEAAGVAFDDRRGVHVNDRLQTSSSDIYGVGDVCTRYQFTHAADFMARLVVRNALFFGRDRFSRLLIPWSTYTQPEIAHVGLYESDLEERGIGYETLTRRFEDVDRAIVDEETTGFVRVHIKRGSDEILGATIVGEHAGDLISEITLAMRSETGLGALANVIHPYPTAAEAIRQLGDAYNRTRLTPTVKKLFRGLLALRR